MERPPTPSGRRTRSKTERPLTAPPSHRSASPRATSTSGRRRQFARHPASFAAAASTPPRTGYYAPLVAATPRDDDNPFDIDSGADDDDSAKGGPPLLLTDPAGADGAPANATEILAAIAGASKDSGTRSGVDPNDSGDPPPLAAPGTAAAVLADFAILLEKHVSALNERIDTLHAETKSNHGHITKRLFPLSTNNSPTSRRPWPHQPRPSSQRGRHSLQNVLPLRIGSRPSSTGSPPLWSQPRRPLRLGRVHVNPPMTPLQGFVRDRPPLPSIPFSRAPTTSVAASALMQLMASLASGVSPSLRRLPPPLHRQLRL
jgi:hypothetical protein